MQAASTTKSRTNENQVIPDGTHKLREKEFIIAILSALANRDSLEIFELASHGLDATTSVLEEHGFTRKRYYVHLKELVDLGLICKDSRKYIHTALGRKVYTSLIQSLEDSIHTSGKGTRADTMQ